MTASHVITPSEEDARWRFTDHPDGEVEHVTLMTHTDSGAALWLSISALRTCAGRPQSVITADAILFTDQGVQLARGVWPSSSAQIAPDLFFLRTNGVHLDQASCRGELQALEGGDGIRWDLRWQPAAEGHRPLSRLCYGRRRGVLTPQVALEIVGEVHGQGTTHSVVQGRGSLHHVWGRRQPERWVRAWGGRWDDAPDFWFQALTLQLHAHRLSPARTTLYTQMRAERTCLGGTLLSARYPSELEDNTWRFSGTRGDRRIEGWVEASPDEMAGVEQKDPDGRIVQRLVAGRARAQITLLQKINGGWVPLSTGISNQSVLLEIGQRGRHRPLPHWLRSST